MKRILLLFMALCICVGLSGCMLLPFMLMDDSDDTTGPSETSEVSGPSEAHETPEPTQIVDTEEFEPEGEKNFDLSGYVLLDDDLLYEYGLYMVGEKVVTVISVKEVSSDHLSANTSENDGFFFSIIGYFSDKSEIKGIKEDDRVTIAGTVKEKSFGGTISLEDCTLIGAGEIAEDLESGKEEQRAICEGYKQAHEQELIDAAVAERTKYANACESVNYSNVERNPDAYKGKKIKVSGTIIQVNEGLFDSVTIRLQEESGDTWYIKYKRGTGESRLLEDDKITAYGECTGVKSYTSVLGTQITIPSMDMKYYE